MTVPFAIYATTIVDPSGEGTLLPDQTVLVGEDGKITRVGPAGEVAIPEGFRVADGRGKFLSPGLINIHVHLFADGSPLPTVFTSPDFEGVAAKVLHSPIGRRIALARTRRNLRTQLFSGVTTVRSLGDVEFEVVQAAEEIEAGKLVGPRTTAAGPMLSATGGHGVPMVAKPGDGPWKLRSMVRANLRGGVTAIKICATGGVTDARVVGEAGRPQLTEEEMAAICDEAHTAGVTVAAHAQSTEGVNRALRAGVDTIEHGAPMDEESVALYMNNPKSLRGWSALVPTLNAALPLVKFGRDVTGASSVVQQNSQIILDGMLQGMRDAQEHGVTMGLGNDASMTFVPQHATWREMDFVHRYAGLTPAEALNAATAKNATILGLEDVTGQVKEGFDADLVLLNENPLETFRTFAEPDLVVARGKTYPKPRVEVVEEMERLLDQL